MSVKYFDKTKNEWVIFPGTMGAPGKDAYLIAKENGYQGTREEYETALTEIPGIAGKVLTIEETVSNISKTLFDKYSTVKLTISPSIFETGINTSVVLYISAKYDGNKADLSKLTLKRGTEIISTDVNLTEFSDEISNTASYSVDVIFSTGISKSASATIKSYYPQYYGASNKEELTSADILGFSQQSIKSSPVGNVSISVEGGQYIWLCVPSEMNIKKVTSGGFDVPIEPKKSIDIEGKTSYNCYRSSNTFVKGIFNGKIE